jgi:flagellar hook-associated protein 2
MANGVLGLGSGQASALSSDLIDKLKTAERKSTVAPLETKIENIATEKTTFTSISTKVSELLAAIKPFDLFVSGGITAFEQKSASTSGDSVTFDAADIKTLNTGSTNVNISQLAQKDVYQSKTFNSATKDTKVNLGTLNVTLYGKDLLPSGIINTTNLTYQQLADKISAETGMTANIEQVGTDSYRLVIKSEESGASNKLVISGDASSALGLNSIDTYQSNSVNTSTKDTVIDQGTLTINGENFDTTDFTYEELAAAITAKSGMNATVESVGANYRLNIKSEDYSLLTISGAASSFLGLTTASNHISTGSNVLKAQNMMAEVDGIKYDVSLNNITVEGLKITANKIGNSSINISQDNTQLETQMNNFITKYNELVALVDVEVQSADSKLGDKSTIRSIISTIKDKLFGSYGSDGKKSVFNYGVELDKYGGLSLDSTKFNSAIQNDKAGLKDLFAGTAEKKGLGTILKETLDTMTFTGGLLDSYQKNMTIRETSLNTQKTLAEQVLDRKYELMSAQFASYGTIINQMESAFSGLKMMIAQSTSGN